MNPILYKTQGFTEYIANIPCFSSLAFDSELWTRLKNELNEDLDEAYDYELRLASQYIFIDNLEKELDKRKQDIYKKYRETTSVFKEELCAKAWSSKRVQHLLELGGFELLESL